MAMAGFPALAQSSDRFTGTIISYGSGRNTRVRTGTFDLILNKTTDKAEAERLMKVLDQKGSKAFLEEIDDNDLGKFSIGSRVGPTVNFVLDDMVDGKRRIVVIFQRWIHFVELRYGYRTTDYPFGALEFYIDPETGEGKGTFIGAAKVRWSGDELRIEGFGAFPAQLVDIEQTEKRMP